MHSEQFDDIYFSRQDGLAESRYVFQGGNNLPQAWAGRDHFCIFETGFGTGLNILAVWKLFEETAGPHQRLDLMSVEKYPLSRDQIRAALAPWDLQPYLDRLLDLYPLRIPGFHRINLSDRVTLTLIFDDVHDALPQMNTAIDAWFLDGFAPAKNPDMWSPALFAQIARLSAPGATLASFTAVGHVRRGLKEAGFAIERRKGFGWKYHMTAGVFAGPAEGRPANPVRRSGTVAVVGAGLAGLSAAWHLKRAGFDVAVYDDAGVAAGASGNSAGIMNPKLTAQRSAQSDWYAFAYDYALRFIRDLGVPLRACGSLHLQTSDDKRRKFEAYAANLNWHADHMALLDDASDVAGVPVHVPCLFYPDAAVTSPRAVCAALARGLDIRKGAPQGDVIVLANGAGVKDFCDLPIESVRGQVSRLRTSVPNKTNLCYGGYFTPQNDDGTHMCGATFQPWDRDASVRDDDHARNVAQLKAAIPSIGDVSVVDGWTGFRAAAKDRHPVVGVCGDYIVSVAHGSHGLISGIAAGAVLAAILSGQPMPAGADAINSLDPARFRK